MAGDWPGRDPQRRLDLWGPVISTRKAAPDRRARLEGALANVALIGERLRTLREAGGGFRLP